MKIGLAIMAGVFVFSLLGAGCPVTGDFNKQLNRIVRPYRFNVAQWEAGAVSKGIKQSIWKWNNMPDDEIGQVKEYFDAVARMKVLTDEIEAVNAGNRTGDLSSLEQELEPLQEKRGSLVDVAEKVISGQIKKVLFQQGIYHPADKYIGLKINFPPMGFKLEKPPHLLVISPRDRIESMREVVLRQEVSLAEIERIEEEIDALGVSSIVVGLGGFGGTYPAFVSNEASLRFTVDAAAEEWLHQYLFFKPLGFRYVLDVIGLARNYEVATMNETVASMVSKEIGGMVMERYYPDLASGGTEDSKKSGSDFDREMREIRRTVDEYLAQGEIEQAERFMEERRQYLAIKGYNIRKLNQAYFAFYGAYADQPSSISPIGDELRKLRAQSVSLNDFLSAVSSMTSRADLLENLE